MTLSFDPDWHGTSGGGAGSAFNFPNSNMPLGEDVIVTWVVTNGSPTPVLDTVTQLDSGASPVGAGFTVLNHATPLGGLHIAWGTRHASMDSLQFAFSTGYTGAGIGAANFPAGTYATVMDEALSTSLFTRTLPSAAIFAGVAAKGGGLDSFEDSTADFSSAVFTTSTQRIRTWAVEAPTDSETVTHESFSGTGFNRFHVLGPAAGRWHVGYVSSRA